MRKLIAAVLLIIMATPALCDGTGTLIEWPGWTIESTEGVYMGRKHTSFPLTYLVDNDPATAWVFSGLGKDFEGRKTGFGLTLSRAEDKKPVTADSIWIMNGYNKSRELFLRNNRITELKLEVNGKFMKAVEIMDSMGWHKISIPRQPIRSVSLEFTKFAKGRDDDICVSEIALCNGGNRIDLKMPKAVIYTPGDDCGCGQEYYVVEQKGKRIATHDSEIAYAWSPSGRYVAGIQCARDSVPEKLWVVNVSTGRVIVYQPTGTIDEWADAIRWNGENAVVVDLAKSRYPGLVGREDEFSYRKLTVRIKAP